jgi:dienelactone hydrolase
VPFDAEPVQVAFTNTLSQSESDAIYQQHYVPGTNRAFFEAAFANITRRSPAAVNYRNPARPPLLLLVGGADHISPPALNKKLLNLHRRAQSATESKVYPGRPHFMAGLDGWEEIADDALNWVLEHLRAGPRRPVEAAERATSSQT